MRRAVLCWLAALAAGLGSAEASPRRLTLDQLIGAAQKNPLARMAQARTAAASARADEAEGLKWASAEATGFLAPSPRIECDDPECTTTSPNDLNFNIAGVFGGFRINLVQPIFTSGKLSSAQSAAHKAARSAQQLEAVTMGELASMSARAYYALKLAREVIAMLSEGSEQIAKGKETLETKLLEGASDVKLQDRFRLETLQAEVSAQLSEAREAERVALASIRALVGDPQADIDEAILESVDYELPASSTGTPDGPLVAAARLGAESLEDMVDFERASYFPDVVMIGGINYAAAQGVDNPPSAFARDPFNTSSAYISLGLRWKLDPLAQPARVARRKAEGRRARARLEAASAAAGLEWQRALTRASEAEKRLEIARKGARSGRAWVASVLQADAVGAASAKDLADAYISYFTQRGRMLRSTHDWNLATVELRRLLGEFAGR
jgi:outer membrane protein TolC